MGRGEHQCYFIVASAIIEIVTPLFRKRLQKYIQSRGFGSLQDFINDPQIRHVLFHLRHRNTPCCTDTTKCVNNPTLPLNHNQWKLLYRINPELDHDLCHCIFEANPVPVEELDINVAGLILSNCCILGEVEEYAINTLLQFKMDYLNYNTDGTLQELEFNGLWTDMVTYILQVDPCKQDDLTRIENRPMDEPLCTKYNYLCIFETDLPNQLDKLDAAGILQKVNNFSQRLFTCQCSPHTSTSNDTVPQQERKRRGN